MTDTQPAPVRPGVRIYLDSHDRSSTGKRDRKRTMDVLRRSGAVACFITTEGVDGRLGPLDDVASMCDEARAADVEPILMPFPGIDQPLARSMRHYEACKSRTRARGQLDMEPKRTGGVTRFWTQPELDGYLALDPTMEITTTRAHLNHRDVKTGKRLDLRGRRLALQLERQASLADVSSIERFWPDAYWVLGAFDEPGDPRMLSEFKEHLRLSVPQARRTGALAVWSAHVLDDRECDALREFGLSTF